MQDINTLLQWRPFPDASTYTLRINACDDEGFCDQGQVWQQMIDQVSPRYDGAALQSERTYQLSLTTVDNQGRSQTATLRFRRISEAEISRIQTEIAALESQDLSPDAKAIAQSDIYESIAQPNTRTPADIGLVFEAIAELEDAIGQGSQTPYLYRLLGDSYLQVGLLESAKTSYAAALDYAQSPVNASDRAAAQVGLANIAAAQGQLNEAEAWLQRAKIGYTLLGDIPRVENLQNYLEALEDRTGNS